MNTLTPEINNFNPEPEIILKAAKILKSGGLVAFPTETVYGLGANALNPDAVKKIYEAKCRPSDNPLILHMCSFEQAEKFVYMNDLAEKLIKIFSPAPLTLVLKSKPVVPLITRGNLDTAAIRIPNNPVALALIEAAEIPIAAPSANLSGRPSPTDFESVFADMNGRIDMILNAGSVDVGIESTVIDVSNPEKILMLRPGGMSRNLIENALGKKIEVPDKNSLKKSPGTRYKHYAPNIPVKIFKPDLDLKDINSAAFIGLHEPDLNFKSKIIFKDVKNYARGLFAAFRKFESEKFSCIVAELPDNNSGGICEGLRDRLSRAAGVCV